MIRLLITREENTLLDNKVKPSNAERFFRVARDIGGLGAGVKAVSCNIETGEVIDCIMGEEI